MTSRSRAGRARAPHGRSTATSRDFRSACSRAAAAVASAVALACTPAAPAAPAGDPTAQRLRAVFLEDLDTLAAAVDSLAAALRRPDVGDREVHARFARARDAYKRVEPLLEVYAGTAADRLNGPPLPRVEPDAPDVVLEPEGFQAIEERLFPVVDRATRAEAADLAELLRGHVNRARAVSAVTPFSDANVWEAIRATPVRVTTLGLAGFDSPVADRGVPESAIALAAAARLAAAYAPRMDPAVREPLAARFAAAEAMVRRGGSVTAFPHLTFLAACVTPLLDAIDAARRSLGIALPAQLRLWRADAASPFAPGAWDPYALRAPELPRADTALTALGERIFFDPAVAGDGTRACASCHIPALAFTDARPRSAPLPGRAAVLRNAPTLWNVALQPAQFADGRAAHLEDQVADVVHNADEMQGSLPAVARRVATAAAYAEVRPAQVDAGVVRRALGAYLRSLVALDAPFDRAARGDTLAMTASARRGYDVFVGKGKCATCHFAPLFGGAVPPAYLETEYEVLGVPDRPHGPGQRLDPDIGRMAVTRAPLHRHAFKTPALRNVALTAPYMHNGVFRTLDEVIEFYAVGGGAGLGLAVPNQTLPFDRLDLTPADRRDLVAFLESLTDTTARRD